MLIRNFYSTVIRLFSICNDGLVNNVIKATLNFRINLIAEHDQRDEKQSFFLNIFPIR